MSVLLGDEGEGERRISMVVLAMLNGEKQVNSLKMLNISVAVQLAPCMLLRRMNIATTCLLQPRLFEPDRNRGLFSWPGKNIYRQLRMR